MNFRFLGTVLFTGLLAVGFLSCDVAGEKDNNSSNENSSVPGPVSVSWDESLRLGLAGPIRKELKFLLNNFLVYHLEKRIRSARFLD